MNSKKHIDILESSFDEINLIFTLKDRFYSEIMIQNI